MRVSLSPSVHISARVWPKYHITHEHAPCTTSHALYGPCSLHLPKYRVTDTPRMTPAAHYT